MAYLYDKAVHWPNLGTQSLPDPNVETLHPISIKRDTLSLQKRRHKYTSAVQRGEEGIPRSIQVYLHMWVSAMSTGKKPFVIAFIFFVSLLCLEARSQSPENMGTAQGRGLTTSNSIDSTSHKSYKDSLDLLHAVTPVPKSQYNKSALMEYPELDLEKYPLIQYRVDTTKVGYVRKGECIADAILDMPLRIVNHPEGKEYTTLRELSRTEYLVLDFWTRSCKPCILSMEKWEGLRPQISDRVTVVGVHLDADYKAITESKKRNWTHIQIIGAGASILSRYLCKEKVLGPSAWIRDGRLFGLSQFVQGESDFVLPLLNGAISDIPEHIEWRPD